MSQYVRTSGSSKVPPLTSVKLNQAGPVQNTWYTVCNLTDILFNCVAFQILATGETLEVRLTIEGIALGVGTQVAVAGTTYQLDVLLGTDGTYWVTPNAIVALGLRNPLYMRSLKVEIRKTTAAGAGNLQCAVSYNQY